LSYTLFARPYWVGLGMTDTTHKAYSHTPTGSHNSSLCYVPFLRGRFWK